MIEAYAFLAAFTVQILVLSVLHPAWFTRDARAKGEAQLPGWDRKSRERFLSVYRAVNAGIAVLGLVLLGWLFSLMRSTHGLGSRSGDAPARLVWRGADVAVRSRFLDRSLGQKEGAHARAARA